MWIVEDVDTNFSSIIKFFLDRFKAINNSG